MNNSGKQNSTRLVFFGNEQLATGTHTDAPILHTLIDAGYTIVALILSDNGTRSRNKQTPAVVELAQVHNIPILRPISLREIEAELVESHADAAILAAYGKLVPASVIDIFPGGIINVHPSLLPKHRGSTPIESVLLEGDIETGVSIMQLAQKMDAGPIYGQSSLSINSLSKQELVSEISDIGATMLCDLLPEILLGTVVAAPQDDSAATYTSRIEKNVRNIDLTKPANLLVREITAYAGWPGSRLIIAGKECAILTAHAVTNSSNTVENKTIFVANKNLYAQTSDGLLSIDTLKPAGKSEMTAQAFLAGHAHLL